MLDIKGQPISVGDRVVYCFCNILYEGVVAGLGPVTCDVVPDGGDPEWPDSPYYDQVRRVI